jgi:hypothetical protein
MTTRLANDEYKRPKQTLQEKYTKEEIDEKLIGYTLIGDIDELKALPLGTEIRYFSFVKEGKKVIKKFRLGGRLLNKDNADKYIVCAVGLPPNQKTWSIQIKDAEIYYKQKVEDVLGKQEEVINETKEKYIKEIDELKQALKAVLKEKKDLVLKYNDLVEKYTKLKTGNK